MSGSIDPDDQWLIPCIRSQTGRVCDVWCGPHDSAPTTRHPRSATGLHPAFSFQILTRETGSCDVRLGGGAQPEQPVRGPGWTWRGRARPVQCATRGPGRHTGAAMWARLSCEWSEESETCEWWLCSSHCMAPPPLNKICQKVAAVRGTYPCPRAGILAVIMTTNFTLSTTTTRKPLGSTPETGN